MALCIARRESGLYEFAANPSSSASGIFQIVDSTWYAWRFGYFADRANMLDLSTSVFDARANVMIGVWAMNAYGLGPWGYGC